MRRVAQIAWQLLVCAPGMVWLVPTGAALLAVGVIGLICAANAGIGGFAGVVGVGLLLMVFSPLFAGGVTVGALARRSATLLAPLGRVHLWLGATTAQLLLCAAIAAVPAALLVAFPGIADGVSPGLIFERVFGTALALVAVAHTATSVLMLVPQRVRMGAGLAALPIILWMANVPASPKQAWIASHSGELTLERCLFIAVMWALFAAGIALLPRRHRHAARLPLKDASRVPLAHGTWSRSVQPRAGRSTPNYWSTAVAHHRLAVMLMFARKAIALGRVVPALMAGERFVLSALGIGLLLCAISIASNAVYPSAGDRFGAAFIGVVGALLLLGLPVLRYFIWAAGALRARSTQLVPNFRLRLFASALMLQLGLSVIGAMLWSLHRLAGSNGSAVPAAWALLGDRFGWVLAITASTITLLFLVARYSRLAIGAGVSVICLLIASRLLPRSQVVGVALSAYEQTPSRWLVIPAMWALLWLVISHFRSGQPRSGSTASLSRGISTEASAESAAYALLNVTMIQRISAIVSFAFAGGVLFLLPKIGDAFSALLLLEVGFAHIAESSKLLGPRAKTLWLFGRFDRAALCHLTERLTLHSWALVMLMLLPLLALHAYRVSHDAISVLWICLVHAGFSLAALFLGRLWNVAGGSQLWAYVALLALLWGATVCTVFEAQELGVGGMAGLLLANCALALHLRALSRRLWLQIDWLTCKPLVVSRAKPRRQ